jgi:hypothetical protein
MTIKEAKEIILDKIKPMKRADLEQKIFDVFNQHGEDVFEEFRENYLNTYELDSPAVFATEMNDIIKRDTPIGCLFQDLVKVTSDKIGMGEVLLNLCIKDSISGGTDDTDIIMTESRKKYEVKKISEGGVFSFSERFTEYNDLGLILNIAILNFGHLGVFAGKNLYTTRTKEVRTFKMLLEKFLLPSENGVPFYRDQFVVKVNGELRRIENGFLFHDNEEDPILEAYYSMFNFRDQVLLSKIKPISMNLFRMGCGEEECTKEIIHDLFSITALKQILKGVEGVFLILPDFSISYFTPHEDHDSLYDPREIYLYDISRNKMNFKGPFLKNTRAEKTPGELPGEFQLL